MPDDPLDHRLLRDPLTPHMDTLKRAMASGELYATDLVIVGMIQRSLDVVRGAKECFAVRNLTCAIPLLRLQLDNLMRLAYMATLDNADALALEIMRGKQLHELRDAEGKELTGARLRDYARPTHPWLDELYAETSRLVHFSDRDVFHVVRKSQDKEGWIEVALTVDPERWPLDFAHTVADAFILVTETLLETIEAWGDHKVELARKRENAPNPTR